MLMCAIRLSYRGGKRLLFVVDIVRISVDRWRRSRLLLFLIRVIVMFCLCLVVVAVYLGALVGLTPPLTAALFLVLLLFRLGRRPCRFTVSDPCCRLRRPGPANTARLYASLEAASSPTALIHGV